jgi:poly-gamma-glutamate capsule biosynthesis protein CapA/YwtB (metallophosphatase superfamily)
MHASRVTVFDLSGGVPGILTTILLVLCVQLAPTSAVSQTPPPLSPQDMAMTMSGSFTLVSVGDLILRTPVSQSADEGVQAALRIIRDGDVAFGNLEGNLVDFRTYRGLLSGFVGSAEAARDLEPMGFDLVNRANNHLFDSEADGMFETNRLLDEAGIVHAGSGRNLDEAAAPAYLETPKGRVGLVGMHTPTFATHERLAATSRTGNLGGRPGLNMLRYSEEIVLTRGQIEALRQVRDELLEYRDGYDNPRAIRDLGPDRVSLFGSASGREDPTYRVAREGEVPGTIDYTLNRGDVQRSLRSIRNAKQYSDFVIATIHSHQSQSVLETQHFSTAPPDFYVELAHAAIDAGADAWVGQGVQTLRGIEIYRGKPVFYGLGEFVRQMQMSLPVQLGATDWSPNALGGQGSAMSPESVWWQAMESIVAVSRYEDGELVEVLVHPIDLRYDGTEIRPDSQFGIPQIASPELGRQILERVQRLSGELGTEMTIEGNRGVIRIAEQRP